MAAISEHPLATAVGLYDHYESIAEVKHYYGVLAIYALARTAEAVGDEALWQRVERILRRHRLDGSDRMIESGTEQIEGVSQAEHLIERFSVVPAGGSRSVQTVDREQWSEAGPWILVLLEALGMIVGAELGRRLFVEQEGNFDGIGMRAQGRLTGLRIEIATSQSAVGSHCLGLPIVVDHPLELILSAGRELG